MKRVLILFLIFIPALVGAQIITNRPIGNMWINYQTTKAIIGADSSLVHNPATDTTYAKGQLRVDGSTQDLLVDAAGYVGINSTPSFPLDVNGEAGFGNLTNTLVLVQPNFTKDGSFRPQIVGRDSSIYESGASIAFENGGMEFRGDNNYTGTASLVVDSNGYVSTPGLTAFGEMYIDDTDADTILFAGGSTTPATSTDWLQGEIDDFTYSAGGLTYTGTQSGTFLINVSVSFSFSESGVMIEGWIYKEGVEVGKSEFHRQIGTGGDVGNAGITCLVPLSTNDTIQLYFAPGAHTGGDNLILQNANVNVTRIK